MVLPLDYGMSLADTAKLIGVSVGWACQLRRRFMRGQVAGAAGAPKVGGRNRQNMSLEEEREFLAPFLESAAAGGLLVVGQIKAALDRRLGRTVALASAYNLLHRHHWRKLAPDKRHPKSDPLAWVRSITTDNGSEFRGGASWSRHCSARSTLVSPVSLGKERLMNTRMDCCASTFPRVRMRRA